MNKQELQEYIKNYIQEAGATKTYVIGNDSTSKKAAEDEIQNNPKISGTAKNQLRTQIKTAKPGSQIVVPLEEESQTYGDAITKTYMYLDAIYDRLEDMDPESPQAQELKAKFDDFNDNILKPIFRDIIGR
jgi:hypothetical protein